MKKPLLCLAAALAVACTPLCVPGLAVCGAGNQAVTAAEPVTDVEEIVNTLDALCAENGLPASVLIAPADYAPYPEYAGMVVVEFHLTQAPGTDFSQMSAALASAAAKSGIFKERYRIAVLVNGARSDANDPEEPNVSKVNPKVTEAFAAGAETVEAYISFTFDAGGISLWTHEKMLEYQATLDPAQYTEEEILVMAGQYWEKLQIDTLTAAREETVAEIVDALGADPDSVEIDGDYRFSCVLTEAQAALADGVEAIRSVSLKSAFVSMADLGLIPRDLTVQIETQHPDVYDDQGVTRYMMPMLAFYWKGEGTPENAEIGGHTLTLITERMLGFEPYEVQSIADAAKALNGWEGYGSTTYTVPDGLIQRGFWIVSGAGNPEFAAALLDDPRIDICGILYTTEQKDYDWDTDEDGNAIPIILEDLDDLHYSLALVPLKHIGTGDIDRSGTANIADAVLLARFNAEDAGLDMTKFNAGEADLNADGTVDALDLAALLCQLANIAA